MALLELGTLRQFDGDRVLLREGEVSSHLFLLLDGCVKVTAMTPEGKLALLAIRVGGDLIGELASMDDQPRVATVTTAGPLRARLIKQADFHYFLSQFPDASRAVSRSVGAKLRWATRRRIDFSGCEVRVRLARVLAELAAGYGHREADRIVIGVALTQPELAALVGAAEPTVHKALAEARRAAIIDTGYRQIIVLDAERLHAVAGVD
ncbi:Crp/Fnr family transcriptional regulator [Amycolatopsis sp. 195334CR]|uniref:Crp/Fnr family transcriptional regulator n=1 Tax=Amycolatopsis sp. 195334CR TaxID=2814588 RepID=UPI001A8E9C5A|nr:Crp/Fnr family transcriptional regulator [Amycolatopsis sp. 195334CR]MBN6042021.1 Crp/Fnr family transcriptional regulator [Amycolatopsis sp. 195334CR]